MTACLVVILALPGAVAAAGPWMPQPGEYYSEFRAARGNTEQFRDDGGGSADLWHGAEIETRTITSYNEIGWREKWSLVFGTPFQSQTVRLGPLNDATETGLGDLTLGVRYGLIQGQTALAIQADWVAPLGADRFSDMRELRLALLQNESTDTLNTLLARSSLSAVHPGQRLGARASFGTSFPQLNAFFEAEAGGRYHFNAEDVEIFGSSQLGFWVLDDVYLGATYDLAFSTDYPFAVRNVSGEDVIETRETSRQLVGPKLVFRVDDRLDLIAGSRHLFAGRNTMGVNEVYIGIAFKQTRLNRLQGFLGGTARP